MMLRVSGAITSFTGVGTYIVSLIILPGRYFISVDTFFGIVLLPKTNPSSHTAIAADININIFLPVDDKI